MNTASVMMHQCYRKAVVGTLFGVIALCFVVLWMGEANLRNSRTAIILLAGSVAYFVALGLHIRAVLARSRISRAEFYAYYFTRPLVIGANVLLLVLVAVRLIQLSMGN